MPRLAALGHALELLEAQGLLRLPETQEALRQREGEALLMACSNDYLGLSQQNVSRETSHGKLGSGASRLVYGTTPEHLDLEARMADWVGMESALLFTSGYAANLGVLQALVDEDAALISDRLNHASIIDGCRLSRAQVVIVEHCNPHAVEQALLKTADASARWVVTESYFSMDGTSPDLTTLRELCDRHDASLVVDEAHALGVFGPEGSGLCRQQGVRADVLVGTFGKALGAQGAAVCGAKNLSRWLYNRARSFVFSTAPSPWLCQVVAERIGSVRAADALRVRLHALASKLRAQLQRAAAIIPEGSHGPIVPLLLGDARRALAARDALRAHGIAVQAIRPPTVPAGTARLRVTVNAGMSDQDVARLGDALLEVLT